jgi:hypothetical protein
MYVFDPVDVKGDVPQGVPAGPVGGFGPNVVKGGQMNKTQINMYAKHIAIAAAVVWAVTKFV